MTVSRRMITVAKTGRRTQIAASHCMISSDQRAATWAPSLS
jgi:hypothetical protein